MPRIYDSSGITQRRRDQIQAGSFINRIQSTTNPQTSYGPLQGNYDASIMNSIKMGQPKEFYRNNGCVIISNGCPCPPITTVDVSSGPSPPVILAPGPVRNITVVYGSVIVTWEAPDTGGTPDSYTIIATSTGNPTVIVPGITSLTYSFATGDLIDGQLYQILVIGVNSNGTGASPASIPSVYAPYAAPTTSVTNNINFGSTLDIAYTFTDFSPNQYKLTIYINGIEDSVSNWINFTPPTITITSLNPLNLYQFKLQLRNGNQYSSISSLSTPSIRPWYTVGPNPAAATGSDTSTSTATVTTSPISAALQGGDVYLTGISGIASTIGIDTFTISGLLTGTPYSGGSFYIQKITDGITYRSIAINISNFNTLYSSPGVSLIERYVKTVGPPDTYTLTLNFDSGVVTPDGVTLTVTNGTVPSGTITTPGTAQFTGLEDNFNYGSCTLKIYTSGPPVIESLPSTPFIVTTEQLILVDPATPGTSNVTVLFTQQYTSFTPDAAYCKFYSDQGSLTSASSATDTSVVYSGLQPSTQYDLCQIVLGSNDGLSISVDSTVFNFTTNPVILGPAPNVTGFSVSGDTVTISYDEYQSFTPTSGTLHTDTGPAIYSASYVTLTVMEVSGLSPNDYTGCYIILRNSPDYVSAQSTYQGLPTTFSFTVNA